MKAPIKIKEKPAKGSHDLQHESISIDELWVKCIANYKLVGRDIIVAHKKLVFQNKEKEKRAAELIIANKELVFQNLEKEKRAAELIIANKELRFQNLEKGKRAAELIIANKELVFQNKEKENRAAELIIANKELRYQNLEKGKRAAELIIANKELRFQNQEKEKRAAELIIANKELAFQNQEKEKRAAELIIANKELAFQNQEKEKRAAELIIANKELVFQNQEKEKRAAELIIANEELRYQTKEKIKRAAELLKAEDSDRLKSVFLANMSHEIRTPMNGILGFTELLKNPHLTDERQQKYISMIEKGGARMLSIINDLIDISKIESGQTKLTIAECNINEQIEYLYAFFKPEVESKGMQIFYQNPLPESESIILTDREKLLAILTNFVKNAIKYSDTGTIEFGYRLQPVMESEDQKNKPTQNQISNPFELLFFVKDAGIGIPHENIETIFDRFIQVDAANNRSVQGAGLGLAISKAYVEMLGGRIWVESEPGNGSTFSFSIPYNVERKEKPALKDEVSMETEELQMKDLKILIVEDDELSALLETEIIKDHCKIVLHVRTGLEAIGACRENPDIDLVLMDIQMQEMDGYEATRQIRQFNKDVTIIAQTAFAFTGEKEKAIEAGCNYYIPKPIDPVGLIQLITMLLSGGEKNPDPTSPKLDPEPSRSEQAA